MSRVEVWLRRKASSESDLASAVCEKRTQHIQHLGRGEQQPV